MLDLVFGCFSCVFFPTYTAYEGVTQCSETLAYKIQTAGNHRKTRIQHLEHGVSLKSGKCLGLKVLVGVYHSFYVRYETSHLPGRGADPPAHHL